MSSTSFKRITVSLTKEDNRQLKYLSETLGENINQIMRRALYNIYNTYREKKPPKISGESAEEHKT